MQDDLAKREREIQWPAEFDPERADLFSHNSLLIEATSEKIWSKIINVAKWPEWYPNAKDVTLLAGARELGEGVRWRWSTFGVSGESWIVRFEPFQHISWSGAVPGSDMKFYHTWFLKPDGAACMVTTDEVAIGKDAAHLRETDENLMHRGHDLWLATLKWASEGK